MDKRGSVVFFVLLLLTLDFIMIPVIGEIMNEGMWNTTSIINQHENEESSIDNLDPVMSRSITYSSIRDGTESSLSYMHVNEWLPFTPSNQFGYPATIVVIDAGISVQQYHSFETANNDGLYLDIVKYVTKDPVSGQLRDDIGNYGYDPLIGVTDKDLGYNASQTIHGTLVLSCIEMIARRAQVIYINDAIDDSYGFKDLYKSVTVWQWIYDHAEEYNIRVVTMSWSYAMIPSDSVVNLITALHDEKNIYLVTSMGNDGQDSSGKFPQNHAFVYAVGSIDHENRGKSNDPDYYSVKNSYSGSSQFYQDYYWDKPFASDYGSAVADDPRALDFVMPGNGVPAVDITDTSLHSFKYVKGTSFSVAFLAAAALITVVGYYNGFLDHGGSESDSRALPTPDQIHSVLLDSSSRTTFARRYGYGYINIYLAYTNAYDLGYSILYGGGGGIGGIYPQ